MNKRRIGASFEDMAASYLTDRGYRIIERNFRCRIGEIDLIGRDSNYLCFIEVKYRKDAGMGYPAEAVTAAKIRRISKTAQYYMLINNIPQDTPCRFDLAVILDNEISLIKNAFGGI